MSVSTLKYVSWLYGLKLWGKVSILFKAGISLVLGLTCNLVLFLKFFLIILIDWIMSEISKMEYSQEDGLWSHNSQSWILTVPLLNVCVWIRWWCSVAKSCLTLCDPWTATGLPCLSLSPGVCSDSFMSIESVMPSNHLIFCCPLVLLPSVFSSIRVFPTSWFFTSGGQTIGASASSSVLPVNIQGWFPWGWTGLILLSKGLPRVFCSTTVRKHQFFSAQPSLWSNSHICTWLREKP